MCGTVPTEHVAPAPRTWAAAVASFDKSRWAKNDGVEEMEDPEELEREEDIEVGVSD